MSEPHNRNGLILELDETQCPLDSDDETNLSAPHEKLFNENECNPVFLDHASCRDGGTESKMDMHSELFKIMSHNKVESPLNRVSLSIPKDPSSNCNEQHDLPIKDTARRDGNNLSLYDELMCQSVSDNDTNFNMPFDLFLNENEPVVNEINCPDASEKLDMDMHCMCDKKCPSSFSSDAVGIPSDASLVHAEQYDSPMKYLEGGDRRLTNGEQQSSSITKEKDNEILISPAKTFLPKNNPKLLAPLGISSLDDDTQSVIQNDLFLNSNIQGPNTSDTLRMPTGALAGDEEKHCEQVKDRMNTGNITITTDQELSQSEKNYPCFNSKPYTSPNKIDADKFKNIVFYVVNLNFNQPYSSVGEISPPSCTFNSLCARLHKNYPSIQEVRRLLRPTIFTELESPFHLWEIDYCYMVELLITRFQCVRSDIIRIIFDYILNGPVEALVFGMKNTIKHHFEQLPPCTEKMRTYYFDLLDKGCEEECYFKTCLENVGVFNYILKQLEYEFRNQIDANVKKQKIIDEDTQSIEMGDCDDDNDHGSSPKRSKIEEVTYETLVERHNRWEDIYGPELKQAIDTITEIGNLTAFNAAQKTREEALRLPRLIEALDLIVDLLESDFLICVAKLKRFLKGEEEKVCHPMVSKFVDNNNLLDRVMLLYSLQISSSLRYQLSRLIALMAEDCHMFKNTDFSHWEYLRLDPACYQLADRLFTAVKKSRPGWLEYELFTFLKQLRPSWLRQRVIMLCVNDMLNVNVGTDLGAIVQIVHMNVISPLSVKKDFIPETFVHAVSPKKAKSLRNRALKRNHYGETQLHRLCRKTDEKSDAELRQLLALADPLIDVNLVDNNGWAPLHEAVYHNAVSKVHMLLRHKPPGGKSADLAVQNREGVTPLHEAVASGHLEICKALIEGGGTSLLTKADVDGMTPSDFAQDHPEIQKYFKDVLQLQEEMNLNPDAYIVLPKGLLSLLQIALEDLLSNRHTLKLNCLFKMSNINEVLSQDTPNQARFIHLSAETLVSLKHDQEELRRLKKILTGLSQNRLNGTRYTKLLKRIEGLQKKFMTELNKSRQ